METKKNIYYARTYRRLQISLGRSFLFAGILIIPILSVMILYMDKITRYMNQLFCRVISGVIPIELVKTNTVKYSIINEIEFIELPTTMPTDLTVYINLAVCFLLILLLQLFRKKGRPLVTFMVFGIMIHVASCIFFLFSKVNFPYSLGTYSELYLKQQIGIWLTYIILAGLVVSFIGERGYIFKLVTFLAILAYSTLFGVVRYILYLFILYKFSVLYMALLFFVVGPMYDFSYFVAIYAVFINKITKEYQSGMKKGVWKWS